MRRPRSAGSANYGNSLLFVNDEHDHIDQHDASRRDVIVTIRKATIPMPRRKPRPGNGPDRGTDGEAGRDARRGADRRGVRHPPRSAAAAGRFPDAPAADSDLLYGRHAVQAALANVDRRIVTIRHTPEAAAGLVALVEALPPARRAVLPAAQSVPRDELDATLPPGTVHQGVVLGVEPLPDRDLQELIAAWDGRPDLVILVLDQVTDPQNVGAMLRSAAAFGAAAVVLQDRHGPPLTGTLAKIASGALEVVPLVRVVNLARALEELKGCGFWCTGLAEEGGVDLARVDLSGRCALVLGAEGAGLRRLTRDTCDALARLPTLPPIGSLNVSAAAAVALYQARLARTGAVDLR